mgnify:CR=1 FL=1
MELDKDALIDRIQQQQFHRERVGSLPNSCTPVLDDHEHDDDLDDDEDVDDEAKDEDSKRHDHKAGRIQVRGHSQTMLTRGGGLVVKKSQIF